MENCLQILSVAWVLVVKKGSMLLDIIDPLPLALLTISPPPPPPPPTGEIFSNQSEKELRHMASRWLETSGWAGLARLMDLGEIRSEEIDNLQRWGDWGCSKMLMIFNVGDVRLYWRVIIVERHQLTGQSPQLPYKGNLKSQKFH